MANTELLYTTPSTTQDVVTTNVPIQDLFDDPGSGSSGQFPDEYLHIEPQTTAVPLLTDLKTGLIEVGSGTELASFENSLTSTTQSILPGTTVITSTSTLATSTSENIITQKSTLSEIFPTSALPNYFETSNKSVVPRFGDQTSKPFETNMVSQALIVGLSVAGGVLILMIILISVYCYKISKERQFVGKYSPENTEKKAGVDKNQLVNVLKPPPPERLI